MIRPDLSSPWEERKGYSLVTHETKMTHKEIIGEKVDKEDRGRRRGNNKVSGMRRRCTRDARREREHFQERIS